MDLLLVVCGYSPLENHPTAHTPPLPVAATVPHSVTTIQSTEKINSAIAEKNNQYDNTDKMDILRRRKIKEEIGNDENYKSNAQQ